MDYILTAVNWFTEWKNTPICEESHLLDNNILRVYINEQSISNEFTENLQTTYVDLTDNALLSISESKNSKQIQTTSVSVRVP